MAAGISIPAEVQEFGRLNSGVVAFSTPTITSSPAAQDGESTTSSTSAPSAALYAVQQASIADRDIQSVGFEAFHQATALPPTSPQLDQAIDGDVVITESGFIGSDVTAVVLKPRPNAGVYHVPVPPTDNAFEFLRSHLSDASDSNAGTILFPPNTDFFIDPPPLPGIESPDPAQHVTHVILKDLTDVTVDLNGSTLHFMKQSRGIVIRQSERVVITNGTLVGSGLLTSVAELTPDTSEAGIRFDVLPEYRAQLEASYPDGNIPLITVGSASQDATGQWRIARDNYAELFTNRARTFNQFTYSDGSFIATSPLGEDVFTEETTHVWLLHENNDGNAIHLDNETGLRNITLENLTFTNIPGMGIAGEVDYGLHVRGITFQEPADGAGVFAVSSDGIHINANAGDIVLEDNHLGPNGDDKITVKGNYWEVTAVDPATNQIEVQPIGRNTSVRRWGLENQRVIFIDGQYNIYATAQLNANAEKRSSKRHLITLDQIPASVQVGSWVGNVDHAGGRVIIRNNEMIDSRAQAILVQTSHIAVLNNHFEGMGGPAIKLNMNLDFWYEAIRTGDVLIANNTFSETSRGLTKANDLIEIVQLNANDETVPIIDNVRIIGNQLLDEVPVSPPVDPNDPTTPTGPDLQLLHRNRTPDAITPMIEADLLLSNREQVGLNLRGTEIRYYVDPDGLTPIVTLKRSTAPVGAIQTHFDPLDNAVVFSMTQDWLLDPAVPLALRFEVRNSQNQSFDQSNDPSFIPGETNRVENPAIDVIFGGSVIDPPPDTNPPVDPVDPTPPVEPPVSSGDVALFYTSKSKSPTTDTVEAQFEILNMLGTPQNFKGLELRYYIDADGLVPQLSLSRLNVPSTALQLSWNANEKYISIQFVEDVVVRSNERVQLRLAMTDVNGGRFDQTNDPSFDPNLSMDSPSYKSELFRNGVRLWGQ